MRRMLPRIILWTAGGVLALDVLATLAGRAFGVAYGPLAPTSYGMYFAAGLITGHLVSLRAAPLSGAAVALVESTLGWLVEHALASGPATHAALTPLAVVLTIVIGVLLGAILGLLGGGVGRVTHAWFRG